MKLNKKKHKYKVGQYIKIHKKKKFISWYHTRPFKITKLGYNIKNYVMYSTDCDFKNGIYDILEMYVFQDKECLKLERTEKLKRIIKY